MNRAQSCFLIEEEFAVIFRGGILADSKDPSQNSPKVEEATSNLMSVEDLDKIIADADPSAMQEIEGVREIAKEVGQPLEILEGDLPLEDVENLQKFRGLKAKLKLKSVMFWIWLKGAILEFGKKAAQWGLAKKKETQEAQQKMRHWPLQSKLLFYGGIVLVSVTLVFIYFAFFKKSLYYEQELFIRSFEDISQQSWNLAEDETPETFYNSSRIPKNIFQLKKIVVNIQPSSSSGSNPMVALEFSLEGASPEVLLEIKDREGEVLDQVQRVIEGFTFDELNSVEGKREMTEKVRVAINRRLTLGKIRAVYIQGFIIKP